MLDSLLVFTLIRLWYVDMSAMLKCSMGEWWIREEGDILKRNLVWPFWCGVAQPWGRVPSMVTWHADTAVGDFYPLTTWLHRCWYNYDKFLDLRTWSGVGKGVYSFNGTIKSSLIIIHGMIISRLCETFVVCWVCRLRGVDSTVWPFLVQLYHHLLQPQNGHIV